MFDEELDGRWEKRFFIQNMCLYSPQYIYLEWDLICIQISISAIAVRSRKYWLLWLIHTFSLKLKTAYPLFLLIFFLIFYFKIYFSKPNMMTFNWFTWIFAQVKFINKLSLIWLCILYLLMCDVEGMWLLKKNN